MKYIEETLQNLTGECYLYSWIDWLYWKDIHPLLGGNKEMANKATFEDSLYTNSGRRIPIVKQWKS